MPPRARCARSFRARAPRFDEHWDRRRRRTDDHRAAQVEVSKSDSDTDVKRLQRRHGARSQSPARAMIARTTAGRDARARQRRRGPPRRGHQRAQRAIEPPLSRRTRGGGSRRAARARRPAMLERAKRRRRRQLAAADREAQAVAGHRIDEARRVAGEQQAVDWSARDVHRQRTEHDRRAAPAARRRTDRAAADRRRARGAAPLRVAQRRRRRRPDGFTRQTFVSPPGTGATPM